MPVLYNAPLFWPEHRYHIWTYCIYLGPYTSPKGDNYDLGIYISPEREQQTVSAAITFGNEPQEYFSGPIDHIGGWERNPHYKETYKRAMALKLHPTMYGSCVSGISDLQNAYQKIIQNAKWYAVNKYYKKRKK